MDCFRFIIVIFLSSNAYSIYVTDIKENYFEANKRCELAIPPIIYTPGENLLLLDEKESLGIGERVWVGYSYDLEVLRYLGCIKFNFFEWVITKSTIIRTDIGQCQSYCYLEKIFGVRTENGSTTCHCLVSLDQSFLSNCNGAYTYGDFLYGGPNNRFSIYKMASSRFKESPNWRNTESRCSFYEPVSATLQWGSCSLVYEFLCSKDLNGTVVRRSGVSAVWSLATEGCLITKEYLLPDFSQIRLNDSIRNELWTPYVKTFVTLARKDDNPTDREYGYIERNKNNEFVLNFGSPQEELVSLCTDQGQKGKAASDEITTSLHNLKNWTRYKDGYNTSNSDFSATSSSYQIKTENTKGSNISKDESTFSSNKVEVRIATSTAVYGNAKVKQVGGALKIGIYVSISSGVLLVAVLVSVVICTRRKRRAKRQNKKETSLKDNFNCARQDINNDCDLRHVNTEFTFKDNITIDTDLCDEKISKNKHEAAASIKSADNHTYSALELTGDLSVKKNRPDDYDDADGVRNELNATSDSFYIAEKNKVEDSDQLTISHTTYNGYSKVVRNIGKNVNFTGNQKEEVILESEYDQLDGRHVTKKKTSSVVNVGDHIYDTFSKESDTYDRIYNAEGSACSHLKEPAKERYEYHKMKDSPIELNDTYSHVNNSQSSSVHNHYNVQNCTERNHVITDNPYDHTN